MSNVLDYLAWRGDISFDVVPFGKIDALILAQLSYNKYEGLVDSNFNNPKTLKSVVEEFVNLPDFEERKKIGAMINILTSELLIKAAQTDRFKDIKLCNYKVIYDEKKEQQFSAMTYLIGKKVFVVFRGTDDSIVGWKEDFNLVTNGVIPSQLDSIKYLEEAAANVKGEIGIIGHSKGGYLAMYCAAEIDKKIKKRICSIYNFDGPGFSKEYLESDNFKAITPVLTNYYPGCSVVGMVYYHTDNFEIVKCDGFIADQHDPFAWQVIGNSFVNMDDFEDESKFFHNTVNDWVQNLGEKERESTVKALFDVIESSGCKTNTELNDNKIHATGKMLQTYANLEKGTKEDIHLVVRVLQEAVKNEIPFLNPLNIRIQDVTGRLQEMGNKIQDANTKFQEAHQEFNDKINEKLMDARKTLEEKMAEVQKPFDLDSHVNMGLGKKGSSKASDK